MLLALDTLRDREDQVGGGVVHYRAGMRRQYSMIGYCRHHILLECVLRCIETTELVLTIRGIFGRSFRDYFGATWDDRSNNSGNVVVERISDGFS
nr:hypothetical protein [Pseudidiomarina sp. 1ASP75-14]